MAYFNISLSVTNKIEKTLNLMEILRILHFTSALCTSFSSAHGTFTIGKHNQDLIVKFR